MANDLQLEQHGITDDLLNQFAAEILKNPTNREQIALRLTGGDFAAMNSLLERAMTFEFSQRVIQLNRTTSDSDKLKSKAEFMLEVADKLTTFNGELWLKGAQFYAKLAGFVDEAVDKGGVTLNVIQVPVAPQTREEKTIWESNAMAYNSKLQQEAKEIDS